MWPARRLGLIIMSVRLACEPFCLHRTPVRYDVRPFAVNVQPGQRFGECAPVQQAALRALWRLDIEEPWLHRQDLVKALDVTAGDRQNAELHPAFQGVCRETLPASHQTYGVKERARENGGGQRFGRRFKLRPVAIQPRD